jgi:ribosomal protein S21
MKNNGKENADIGFNEFIKRVEKTGPTVYVKSNSPEDIAMVIQIFKRRVEKFGILDEYKSKQYYLKPSAKRKLKKQKYAK